MKKLSKQKRNQIVAAALLVLAVIVSAIIYVRVGQPMTELVKDTDRLKAWVEAHGWGSRIAYTAAVFVQVIVAVIPGEPLEMAAGFVFGPIEGMLICMAGTFLGSMAVFGLVRVFGMRLVRVFFSQEKIDSLKILKNPKRLFIITAVLMILPGTPKDLLTYCAGLTNIPFGTWMLLSSLGRIPSIITSTWGGHAISEGRYFMAAIIFGVTTLLCGAGMYVYGRIQKKKSEKDV